MAVSATECALYFCVNTLESVVENGVLHERVVASWHQRDMKSYLFSGDPKDTNSGFSSYEAWNNHSLYPSHSRDVVREDLVVEIDDEAGRQHEPGHPFKLTQNTIVTTTINGASIRGWTNWANSSAVNKTTCNGIDYRPEELAGYGYVVADAVDKFDDTLGGLGSSIHVDLAAWKKLDNGSYTGVLWSMPDRGWNTQGTLNFNPRVHNYIDTILFSGPDGTPCTGLDADASESLPFSGFPDLPITTYTGDGFGGDGPGGTRIPIDAEGFWVNEDSTFWVSDEYGSYIYHFGTDGKMLGAIRPNDAIVPMRRGKTSFSADSTPIYAEGEYDDVDPVHPDSGRENNECFEGITVSKDGKSLWVLLQTATVQDGGLIVQTSRYVHFLKYDVKPTRAHLCWGVGCALPLYGNPEATNLTNPKVAAQSEIFALENGQFLVLSRNSGAGCGGDSALSVYRQIDIFDISDATHVKAKGNYDCTACNVASRSGELKEITPATYCSSLDFNVNAQLNRFGLHDGGDQDEFLLESIGVVPVEPSVPNGELYVFSLGDNDLITQKGYMNGGKYPYADDSGNTLHSQALVFKISISS
ncbi:esterase-like activity of phytase-domain-containing protein [Hypoxylon cercidicola]|nr:esterase-like activity of phytase-domain-containing protein [Hypoxylon cercidicola]